MKLSILEGDVFKRLPELPSESIDLSKEYIAYAKKRLNWGQGFGVEYDQS